MQETVYESFVFHRFPLGKDNIEVFQSLFHASLHIFFIIVHPSFKNEIEHLAIWSQWNMSFGFQLPWMDRILHPLDSSRTNYKNRKCFRFVRSESVPQKIERSHQDNLPCICCFYNRRYGTSCIKLQFTARKMVHELANNDTHQHRCTCHAFVHKNRSEWMNQDLPFLMVFPRIRFSYYFVIEGFQDIHFCRNAFQSSILFLLDFNKPTIKHSL